MVIKRTNTDDFSGAVRPTDVLHLFTKGNETAMDLTTAPTALNCQNSYITEKTFNECPWVDVIFSSVS